MLYTKIHHIYTTTLKEIYVIKTNFMHYLSSVYFVNQTLHISGIFVAHHQEVYCIYIYIYTHNNWYVLCFSVDFCWPANRKSSEKHNMYQLLYIHSIPPEDGLQICPKYVEVYWRNKLRINSASSWFLLHRYTEMYGQQNIKSKRNVYVLTIWILHHVGCVQKFCFMLHYFGLIPWWRPLADRNM